ncbi:integrase, catalytic region [Nostoc commune NIES-4072]|uniref:Integrase, catalytic region n=1 Tax=Nostoc commune NIES-4072 TaxID=2005467 RepID=A0A2R5FXX3_NOSCO|nr:hypothetical protein [Nostoc commune]BBD70915.1 integrase, catalytic region [Nostoc commune HK-02]GBG23616.1 integrase, catalytic region [Nostoc commune NIES-4072]
MMGCNHDDTLLKPYLDEQSITTGRPKERTLRRWLHNYYQAQEKYGYGYLGLISLNHRKGNHNRKLPQHIIEILSKFITEEYENKKQKTKQAVYASFVHSCSKAGIGDDQIPSYKTFINEIKKYPKLEVFQVINGGLPNVNPYSNLQDIDLADTAIKQNNHPTIQEKESINQEKLKVFKKY